MNAKTILFSLLLAPVLALTGCERDLGNNPTLSATPKAPALSASATSVTLAKGTATEVSFTWTGADYGTTVPASYALRLSNPSDPALAIVIPVPAGDKKVVVPFDDTFNKKLVSELGLAMGKPAKLKAELVSSPLLEAGSPEIADKVTTSAPLELTVTPFAFLMRPPYFYLVGDITGRVSWNINSTDFAFFADENDTNVLHYYGYFKGDAAFKLVPEGAVGDWGKVVGMKDGKLTFEGGDTNIKIIPSAGLYHLTLTLNEGEFDPANSTLTAEPIADAKVYKTMGLVGDAVISWDKDTPLSNPGDDHIWVARGVEIKAGQFKIRADEAWGTSWGGVAKDTFPTDFGKATSVNDNNWVVTSETAGTYDVYFNDITGNYVFVKL